MWKTYGEKLCDSKEVADKIDHKIVQPIDALDNGVDISLPKFDGVFSYGAEQIFLAFSFAWLKLPFRTSSNAPISCKSATAPLS